MRSVLQDVIATLPDQLGAALTTAFDAGVARAAAEHFGDRPPC